MAWSRLKFRWIFYFTQALHKVRTARVKPATRRRLHPTGRLTRRHSFESRSVFGIRVWYRCEQRPRIRMERVMYEFPHGSFLDNLCRIHNEDAIGKVTDRRQVVGDINNSKIMSPLQATE